jgi:peptidoglycan/LPS O-acetylase OafA/YrhL
MQINWLPKNSLRGRITGMDSLRAIAALSVLIFHWDGIFKVNSGLLIAKVGHLGVDMFFVLSGFLVSLSLLYTSNLKAYFKKRLLRILPLAYFSLISIYLAKILAGVVQFDWTSLKDFLIHLSFTQSLFQEHYYGNFPVMWTLSVELIFYISLPILFYFGRKNLKSLLLLLGGLYILNFAYRYSLIQYFSEWDTHQRIFFSEQIWGRFDQFIYGISLSLIYIFREKLKILFKLRYIFSLIGVSIMGWAAWKFDILGSNFRNITYLQVFLHSIFAFGFSLFLLGIIFVTEKAGYKKIPIGDYLGEISYGLYVWHFFILNSLAQFLNNPALGLILSILLTILIASFSWFVIEKPSLNLVKRDKQNKS